MINYNSNIAKIRVYLGILSLKVRTHSPTREPLNSYESILELSHSKLGFTHQQEDH